MMFLILSKLTQRHALGFPTLLGYPLVCGSVAGNGLFFCQIYILSSILHPFLCFHHRQTPRMPMIIFLMSTLFTSIAFLEQRNFFFSISTSPNFNYLIICYIKHRKMFFFNRREKVGTSHWIFLFKILTQSS